jgi:hypothetical protein
MKEAFDEWIDRTIAQRNTKVIETTKKADLEDAKAIEYATQKEQAKFLNTIVTNQDNPKILKSLRLQFEKNDL